MQTVRIEKSKLLEIIKKNRDEHRDIFIEAQKNFRADVIAKLDAALAEARDGKNIPQFIQFAAPSDHTKDYDNVIRMIELSEDSILTLTAIEFRSYVMDEWSWTHAWAASNSRYSNNPKLAAFSNAAENSGIWSFKKEI